MALFSFLQAEFPWALGPTDGRYLLRDHDGQAQHVVVLGSLGAPRRQLLRGRRTARTASPDPAPVQTARVTVIDAHELADDVAARAWLRRAGDDTVNHGLAVINDVLFAQRIAAADSTVHEVSAEQALVLRAGYGDGEAVADGRWREASELARPQRRVRRNAALRPQERLALLLGGQHPPLAVEEFVLRARLDLDRGRLLHAAWELRSAYAVGLTELDAEHRADLAERLAELRLLQGTIESAPTTADGPPDPEAVGHALARLEAALRARTAGGFTLPAHGDSAAADPDAERPGATA